MPAADPSAAWVGGWVEVWWDGHRCPAWVDPADLVPAAASAAVA